MRLNKLAAAFGSALVYRYVSETMPGYYDRFAIARAWVPLLP